MFNQFPFLLAQIADNDWIIGVVFFGGGTVVMMTWIVLSQVRRIMEARHRGGATPELAQWVDANARQTHGEIESLRREVAMLKETVGDLMLQVEYNNPTTAEVSERLTPPEFKHNA